MLVVINSGDDVLPKTGEFFIQYANRTPYYDFVIMPDGTMKGADKISVVEKEGVFYLEIEDTLVKKIKLYGDEAWARVDLWDKSVFPELKDGEIEAFHF